MLVATGTGIEGCDPWQGSDSIRRGLPFFRNASPIPVPIGAVCLQSSMPMERKFGKGLIRSCLPMEAMLLLLRASTLFFCRMARFSRSTTKLSESVCWFWSRKPMRLLSVICLSRHLLMREKAGRTQVGWVISCTFHPVGNTILVWGGSIPFQTLSIRFGFTIKYSVGVGRVSRPTLFFGDTLSPTGSIFLRLPLRVPSTITRTICGRVSSLLSFYFRHQRQ